MYPRDSMHPLMLSRGMTSAWWLGRIPIAAHVPIGFPANLIRMPDHNAPKYWLSVKCLHPEEGKQFTLVGLGFLLCRQRDRPLSGYFQFREGERSSSLDTVRDSFFCFVRYLVFPFFSLLWKNISCSSCFPLLSTSPLLSLLTIIQQKLFKNKGNIHFMP